MVLGSSPVALTFMCSFSKFENFGTQKVDRFIGIFTLLVLKFKIGGMVSVEFPNKFSSAWMSLV